MAPGAYLHADIAIRADFSPVIETGLRIQFPAECTVEGFGIIQRDGPGRAANGAFFAEFTKIFNTDIHRFILH